MHFILLSIISFLRTEAVKTLVVKAAEIIVARTDNTVDDAALGVIKEVIQYKG